MKSFLFAIAALSITTVSTAHATDSEPWSQRQAFERDFAIGIYGIGWAGNYLGAGLGGRIRWEPFDWLGVDVFSEHLLIDDVEGIRHDHPVGFNLYVPIRLGEHWRVRPLFGFCSVFSFFRPNQEGGERVDDVHFGVHAGAGLERSLGRFVSFFLDAKAVLYFGHDRYNGGWSSHVGDQVHAWGMAQLNLGVQVHL